MQGYSRERCRGSVFVCMYVYQCVIQNRTKNRADWLLTQRHASDWFIFKNLTVKSHGPTNWGLIDDATIFPCKERKFGHATRFMILQIGCATARFARLRFAISKSSITRKTPSGGKPRRPFYILTFMIKGQVMDLQQQHKHSRGNPT